MRVAIVHDHLMQNGGAERVALALHRMFPSAPVYTSVYRSDATYAGFRDADVRPSFLQSLPGSRRVFRAYLPLYPAAFGRLPLSGYDLVISSSIGWAHGVDTGDAYHLCYWHGVARWLYQTDRYVTAGGPVPWWGRPLLGPVFRALRRWDHAAAARPDVFLANSANTARRLADLYGREAEVVHPPVDVSRFNAATADPTVEPFYLVVARLLPYKRVDLAVRVCTERGARLVVVGDGPARRSLERSAGPTVTFAGRVGDDELPTLYASARALVQCGEEDFGIVPVEANAAGRPVVAFAAGGALETVIDGKTGILFAEQSDEVLHAALDRLEAEDWDPAVLRGHAAGFSAERFARELRRTISECIGAAA